MCWPTARQGTHTIGDCTQVLHAHHNYSISHCVQECTFSHSPMHPSPPPLTTCVHQHCTCMCLVNMHLTPLTCHVHVYIAQAHYLYACTHSHTHTHCECDCVYKCARLSSVPVQCTCTWHVRGCEMHWLHVYEVHACTVLMEACWGGGTITNASLTPPPPPPPNMLPSTLYKHGPRTHVASASHIP